ncbi:FMN-binding protein [Actinoplanes sp. NBC_00393]|uniref:FMN-binding protein n=1 Tax=Actinoplanes sp. NBC_00393 TaxID=2975953 RepID=UPI002E23EE1A
MTRLHRHVTTISMAGMTILALAACSGGDSDTAVPANPGAGPSALPAPSSAPPSAQSGQTTYADGRYTATGWYGSGPSSIDVTVTLADDTITDVEVTPHATNATSLDYQQRFAAGVGDEVIGKDIDEVNLDRVAGSSSTPDGFNDALARIKADAGR